MQARKVFIQVHFFKSGFLFLVKNFDYDVALFFRFVLIVFKVSDKLYKFCQFSDFSSFFAEFEPIFSHLLFFWLKSLIMILYYF